MNHEAALRDLQHSDPRVRAQAADALGRAEEQNRDQAVTVLSTATKDPHPSVRYAALLSLGELEADSALKEVAAAVEDVEPLCREAAAIALGELGTMEAWNPLEKCLTSPHGEVRFQAIASLAQLDVDRAAPLIRPLLSDQDPKVRGQAAAALGDARDEKCRDQLVTLLEDQLEVRHEAALALSRLGDRRAIPVLVAALTNRDRALDAAEALAKLNAADDANVRAALEHELSRWLGDPLVKVRAAEALAKAGIARGREHLLKAKKARRDDVRGLAEAVLMDLDAHR
jgi:HEAT repeat protein